MTDRSCEERIISAWLRYCFHIDPDALTEEEFWARWYELRYCMNKDTNRWDFKFEGEAERPSEIDAARMLMANPQRKKLPKNVNQSRFKKGVSR